MLLGVCFGVVSLSSGRYRTAGVRIEELFGPAADVGDGNGNGTNTTTVAPTPLSEGCYPEYDVGIDYHNGANLGYINVTSADECCNACASTWWA